MFFQAQLSIDDMKLAFLSFISLGSHLPEGKEQLASQNKLHVVGPGLVT